MKKILISLLVIGIIFFVSKFGLIKEMFIVNWLHDKKIYTNIVIKKIDNYLIKKYSLDKENISLISEEDKICQNMSSTSNPIFGGYYCGKKLVFDIKGKYTKVSFHETYIYNGDDLITDDYQE